MRTLLCNKLGSRPAGIGSDHGHHGHATVTCQLSERLCVDVVW